MGWVPNSPTVQSFSFSSPCPWWVLLVRKFTLERSRELKLRTCALVTPRGSRSWAARERASTRPRGVPLSGAQVASPPTPPLPSPPLSQQGSSSAVARGEGRRGYEGFESARAAEWSSFLSPPPASGLNFCKFKLNGAFFCCLPEGACSPPRAPLRRERPRRAPLTTRRARGRRRPGLGDSATGPCPSRTSSRSLSHPIGAPDGTAGGIRAIDPPRTNFSGAGPRSPRRQLLSARGASSEARGA